MAAAISGGMKDLEGFAGAAEKQMDDVNDLVSRSGHLVSAALPAPCAFSSACGPPIAAPLAVLAEALRHGIHALVQDPHREDGLLLPRFRPAFSRAGAMLCSEYTSAGKNKLYEFV